MAKKMTKEELKAKMMANKKSENKKETVEMTNIEILNSVDAGDYEAEEINEALNIDYSFNTEENDDELVDEPVAIKKGKKKATETQGEKEARWLKNAKLTDDGKYQIEVDPDLENRGDHKSWTPYARLVRNDAKTTRIPWDFAMKLARDGKAVEVSKIDRQETEKAKKDAEKALVGEGITKAAMEIAIKAEEAAAKMA